MVCASAATLSTLYHLGVLQNQTERDLPSDRHAPMPGLPWPFVSPLPTRIGRMLRSDTSTALLDRNCKSQLLGSCSRHRSERHVFKFRTYLKKKQSLPRPTVPVEVGYHGAHLYKFIHVNVFLFSKSCLLKYVFEFFGPYASISGDALQ